MEARENGEECKLRVKLVRRPVGLFTCLTCPGSTLVNNSWWKFLYLSASTWHKMHLEPIGVRPVSVHSLNPLLSCLFLVSSSSPPPPSVSALYWRPEGQGYSATDMEHWVFKPKLPLIIRTSQVASTRKDERVCNLNLALLHQQKILHSCVLVQPLNVSLPKLLEHKTLWG